MLAHLRFKQLPPVPLKLAAPRFATLRRAIATEEGEAIRSKRKL